jgi:hypothetical protein
MASAPANPASPAPDDESLASSVAARPDAAKPVNTTGENGDDGVVEAASASSSAVPRPPPTTSPPYWLVQHPHNNVGIAEGAASESRGITMRDNESEDWEGRNSACWARSVEIPDYVVVNGRATNIGAFVVFNIRVQPINVGPTSYTTLHLDNAETRHPM